MTATTQDTTHVVVLNYGAATPIGSMQNATVGVNGNNMTAAAYGNTATNRLSMAALNTGMPTAAVGNHQTNTANVSASVTTVTYGVQALGAASGSTAAVTGNQVGATAVGNNAVSVITGAN